MTSTNWQEVTVTIVDTYYVNVGGLTGEEAEAVANDRVADELNDFEALESVSIPAKDMPREGSLFHDSSKVLVL